MDLKAKYCPNRRNLEERTWALTERLFHLTTKLNRLIGQHDAFYALKFECTQARQELAHLSVLLKDHRLLHRC